MGLRNYVTVDYSRLNEYALRKIDDFLQTMHVTEPDIEFGFPPNFFANQTIGYSRSEIVRLLEKAKYSSPRMDRYTIETFVKMMESEAKICLNETDVTLYTFERWIALTVQAKKVKEQFIRQVRQ